MANITFTDLPNGISTTFGDLLNARLNVLKAAVNATPTPRGDWSAVTNYVAADLVRYNGEQWLALRANLNVAPVEGADWFLFAGRGEAGSAGADIRDGDGVPSNALGADGDYYFDNLTGDYYRKAAGVYQFRASLKGAKGDKGDKGDTGDAGGITSTLARSSVAFATPSLANNATWTGSLAFNRISLLIRALSDKAARVRFYADAASCDADLSRAEGTSPGANVDIVWEGVFTPGTLSIRTRGFPTHVNGDTPAAQLMYVSVTNKSGAASVVNVTVQHCPIQN